MQYIAIVIPVLAGLFALAFGALWLRGGRKPSVIAFFVGYLSLSLCYALNLLPFSMSSLVIGPLVHVIACVGVIALAMGAGMRLGIRMPIGVMASIAVLSTGLLAEAILLADANAIVIVQNGGSALLFTMAATVLWTAQPAKWLDKAVIWTMAMMTAVGFLRPVIALMAEGDLTGLISRTSEFHAVQVIAMTVLPVVLGMILLALVVTDEWEDQIASGRIDALTGLPNRAAFEEQVDELLARAREERIPVSLLVGDIDHFKQVNDTWGHSVGDKVISAFGDIMARKIRPGDVAGRIGGEEFCVLVWNCHEQGAVSLAERLRLSFASEAIEGLPTSESFTASFGIAEWQRGEDYAQCFRRADGALYSAKRSGRNRVESAAGGPSVTEASAEENTDPSTRQSRVVPLRKFK
ncbi:putative diguanylate cyclase (GGDEF) [Erythrobacter sp. NAP1]|uniref:GGDEF domain-containing protein n=1 Tax=Erythrobacter sp. NAP1 TaxID=237727 RepID=UPI0000686CA9|nr:GGDEF domain-containing protein [Erythrobacter sp. NAP1]EAQ29573.1 putative diguanylate cyclase (GGDEF) [Erythrobacter sp. NAP1]